jgi:hypothetical protein
VLLAALFIVGETKKREGEDKAEDKERGAKAEAERLFFSFSTYIFKATSLRRALTSSTSPFRTFLSFLSFSFIKGFSSTKMLYT